MFHRDSGPPGASRTSAAAQDGPESVWLVRYPVAYFARLGYFAFVSSKVFNRHW